jgi:hypothetical protein
MLAFFLFFSAAWMNEIAVVSLARWFIGHMCGRARRWPPNANRSTARLDSTEHWFALKVRWAFPRLRFVCLFLDLEPASLGHLTNRKVLDVVDMLAKIDQDNYPECLRKVYLINSTKIFSMIWNIIQYFFDENTKAKFSFYGA